MLFLRPGGIELRAARCEELAHRPQCDAGVAQQGPELGAAEGLEFGLPRGHQRIVAGQVIQGQARMAQQQVGVAGHAQPCGKQPQIALRTALEVVHPEQPAVLRKAQPARHLRQPVATQQFDDPGFNEAAPTAGVGRAQAPGAARRAQPGPALASALFQLIEQRLAHAGQLMHMLVAVDERRRVAQRLLEGIELGADFSPHGRRVEPAQQAVCDQPAQRAA